MVVGRENGKPGQRKSPCGKLSSLTPVQLLRFRKLLDMAEHSVVNAVNQQI